MTFRHADTTDLDTLLHLEAICFEAARRDGPQILKASLGNPKHEVWVAAESKALLGALFLRKLKRSVRVHSIAVHPAAQSRGIGTKLLELALRRSRAAGVGHVTLEADAANRALIDWYGRFGFKATDTLPHYYGRGHHGLRMRHILSP